MNRFFTDEGKIKPTFLEAIRNNLYRVLQNQTMRELPFKLTNRKNLEYDMLIHNVPTVRIICCNKEFIFTPEYYTEFDEFDYIGAANY